MWILLCVICLHQTKIIGNIYVLLYASRFEAEYHHMDGEDEGEEEEKVIQYSKGVAHVE